MDKSYRIKANISKDTVLNVKLEQDVKTLEILSLKLNQENYYKLHNSNYGVIVGRVLANDAFGVPNVKVSLFISLSNEDMNRSEITNLYPYTSVQSFDKDFRRYNLLPDESNDACYRVVGTFPNKRLVLDDDTVLEVYDKYWKYTTVTNNAGDYMIFGIPTGNQEIHIDLDLSDIGVLSQKPRDMLYKGYNIEQFDGANQFKESTNFNNLSQIISQNQSVFVYPFWGDEELGEIAISRCDINVDYKFEPTCVFMGSLISDNSNQQISHKCTPTKFCGFNRGLVAGEGTIEMIRKTVDGMVEDFQIKGNRLIDNDGIWCYQIPMNLDYVQTDEYGNIVPTDNPNKGIPTRTRVRFRISFAEGSIEGSSKHRAKYLVPNNPDLDNSSIEPKLPNAGAMYEKYYEFGSSTPESCFRNLYWNKVYSIKSFIPRIQTTNKKNTHLYTGIRTTNISNNLNPFPFNKARFKIFFSYRIICLLITFIVYIVSLINLLISAFDLIGQTFKRIGKTLNFWPLKPIARAFISIGNLFCVGCIAFEGGLTDDGDSNTVYYPGCQDSGFSCTDCPSTMPICDKSSNINRLTDIIQENLSQEYDTVNFDFYNDWINGCLYFPIWYWKKTKKKKYLFGLFTKRAQNTYCKCESTTTYSKLKNGYLCALNKAFPSSNDVEKKKWETLYKNNDTSDRGSKKWDVLYRNYRKILYGVIKEKTNKDNLHIYYYSFGNITDKSYITNTSASMPFNRLFSTDLILLGSFNDCDLDGIPKLYRYLPSTTANIPFIGKVTESNTDDDDNDDEEGGSKDTGTVVITGMDWLYNGNKQNPLYSSGLLIDLSCTGANTKLKSVVNLERMSELGVNLDMSYIIPYTDGNTNGYLYQQESMPDGMITRYEINDNESRFMFATLNHLGLDKLVRDKKTTYDVYKLGAMYPVDFDGMLTTSSAYTSASVEKTYDNPDTNYIEYRLGEQPHAYLNGDGSTYYPLYNNSFYFYFGLNEGNTAIDKFLSQYDAECFKNEKYPFAITYSTTPAAWCHQSGSGEGDYATISVELKDITLPYSFRLLDDTNEVLFSGDTLFSPNIYFGYENESTKNGKCAYMPNYTNVLHILNDNKVLKNETYHLIITDGKDKSLMQTIIINGVGLNTSVNKSDLGAKYYGPNITTITDICNNDELYGEISLKEFQIDGYDYKIKKITPQIENNIYGYKLDLDRKDNSAAPHENESVFLYFQVNGKEILANDLSDQDKDDLQKERTVSDYNGGFYITQSVEEEKYDFKLYLDDFNVTSPSTQELRHNCGCQRVNNIETWEWNQDDDVLTFNVWIPSEYKLSIAQYCDNSLNDNVFTQTIVINNGKPFVATLDNMPLLFMLSGNTTSLCGNTYTDGEFIGNNFSFYNKNLNNKKPSDLLSWFMVNRMDTSKIGKTDWLYYLPDYTKKDKLDIYNDYIDNIDVDENGKITNTGKLTIAENLLNWTFSLANATYSVDGSKMSVHSFVIDGGKSPYLIRTFKPDYENILDSSVYNKHSNWLVNSNGFSTVNCDFPDIVMYPHFYAETSGSTGSTEYENGKHYSVFNPHVDDEIGQVPTHDHNKKVTHFETPEFYMCTYFGGFTRRGGFEDKPNGKYEFNSKLKGVTKIPENINPFSGISPTVLNKKINITTYKNELLGNGTYNSYFPAPFIDRRFDYDLFIFTIPDAPKSLQGNTNVNNTMLLNQMTYVHGETRNGIEMSYDEDYNIIGYQLEYGMDDKNNYYFTGGEHPRFYESTLNDSDIRDCFYSSFSTPSESAYADVEKVELVSLKNMKNFSSEFYNSSTVNGIFSAKNYITKRALNLLVPNTYSLYFNNVSCSYDMRTIKVSKDPEKPNDEEKILQCITRDGENVEFELSSRDMIDIEKTDFANAVNISDFNILYYTKIGKNNSEKALPYALRLSYRVNEDIACSTHDTVTCPLTLIASENGRIYEYASNLTSGDSEEEKGVYGMEKFNTHFNIPKDCKYRDTNDDSKINEIRKGFLKRDIEGEFSNEALYDDSGTLIYDNDSIAQGISHLIKNGSNLEMISKVNASHGYSDNEAFFFKDNFIDKDKLNYIGIGGIRRYINNEDNDLLKAIHLVNYSKIYNIQSLKLTYNSVVTANAAEEYITTELTIDFTPLLSDVAKIQDIIVNVSGKIQNVITLDTFISSNVTQSISNNSITFTIKYDKLVITKENYLEYLWQEFYIEMYNGLIYIFSYEKPEVDFGASRKISPFKTLKT